jgi:hypothetical protein
MINKIKWKIEVLVNKIFVNFNFKLSTVRSLMTHKGSPKNWTNLFDVNKLKTILPSNDFFVV